MSMDSARKFLERLKDDSQFAERIGSVDLATRRRIVKAEGFDFSFNEVDAAAKALSEDELARISHGSGTTIKTTSPYDPGLPKAPGYAGNCYGRMYGCTNGCEGVTAW